MMQEGSGNTFADTSGTANTVTAGGTVTWATGPGLLTVGAHFPGTFDSPAANHTNFNPTTAQAFSVSLWVSFDNPSALQMIASQFTVDHGWYIIQDPAHSNQLQVYLASSNSSYILKVFYPPIQAGRLYHLIVTYDGSGTAAGVHLWIDANGAPNPPLVIGDNLSGQIQPNSNVYLGSWSGGTDRLAGYMAGVHLYNRVLTMAEIATLYFAGPMADTYTAASGFSGTVHASDFATLDADCSTGAKIGGGTATDNTAKINAVLATASSLNPIDLVLNGCTVTRGIFIPPAGYVTIEGNGWTSGFYVKSGSNSAAISNQWGIGPPPGTPPSQGASVTLRNFKVNGNRAGNSTIADARGIPWIGGVDLSNINGLTLDTVQVYAAPTYGFHGANLTNGTFSSCNVTSPSHAINTDGFHFDGPENNLTINGGYLYTGDDAVALNGPEGYSGTINAVAIANLDIDPLSFSGMREYGTVTNVTVNNCVLADVIGKNTEAQSTILSPATMDAYNCTPPPPPPPPPPPDATASGSALRPGAAIRGKGGLR